MIIREDILQAAIESCGFAYDRGNLAMARRLLHAIPGHHSPELPPSSPEDRILAALHQLEKKLMTQTDTAETNLAASIAKLHTDLSSKFQLISTALQGLAGSTTDADTAAKLAALQEQVDAMDTQVTGFDPANPPATDGGDAGDTGAGTGTGTGDADAGAPAQ